MSQLSNFANVISSTWQAPGVSEFVAALLGGSMTMLAQYLALRHDQRKDEVRRRDERRGVAWGIFFKIHHAYEALTALQGDATKARALADQQGFHLWQTLEPRPHDPDRVVVENAELVFLLEHRKFTLMQRYQLSTIWLANMIQSAAIYRSMRLEFLSTTPSQMAGSRGSIVVDSSNRDSIMPRVAHLQSLSDSIERVLNEQQPEVRQLLIDYADAMKEMIGERPELELLA